jgi:Arc/MetJ-type ribon-helix-helix transcriptional regulator
MSEPKKHYGTTPIQVRLTDEDKAKVDAIRERFGLPSRAAAIRYAVETVRLTIEPEKKPRKAKQGT